MNKLEKIVYDIVKNNPKFKLMLRNTYQNLLDILPDKQNYFKNPIIYREGFFFGFHDITPFSEDEKYLLSNKLEIPLHMPKINDTLTVGFWNDKFNSFTEIGKSLAWNYHKGCRLQWRGKSNDEIIFNTAHQNQLKSNLYSISKKMNRFIDFPIDTVSPDGQYATSFSYERLEKCMPGYGYKYKDHGFLDDNISSQTGLFIINLDTNKRDLIISLKQISSISPQESMKGALHYVTHSEFSPDGKKISFLHRWTHDVLGKRNTRLVTCNLDGTDIHVSNTTGMVSHYVWDSKHGILAYCQCNGIDGHYIFNDYTLQNFKRVGTLLNSDGHQSYIPNTDCFVTDTYPNGRRFASIYLVNIVTDTVEKIVEVKSFKKYQSPDLYHHWACDLHPRVSPTGKYICFDSVFTNKRTLCIMELENIMQKEQQ